MGETIEEFFEMLRTAGDTALMKGSYVVMSVLFVLVVVR